MKLLKWPYKRYATALALGLGIALSTASCSSEEDINDSTTQRTVIMYVSAQNTLTNWMKRDSTEIWEGAKRLANGQRLVVFMDTQKSPAIYILTNRTGNTAVPAYRFAGTVDSSDPKTLTAVIAWAKQHATANEYALVMASHADGWLPSLNTSYVGVTSDSIAPTGARYLQTKRPQSWGIDAERPYNDYKNGRIGTQMNLKDLGEAITQTGIKLKYIFFDACLMQNLEVAYDLRHAADYMVASPMYIPAAGAHYNNMVPKGLFAPHPTAIAKQYMADARDSNNPWADNYASVGMIISVLDLQHMEALAMAQQSALANSPYNGTEADMTGVQAYLAMYGYPAYHDASMAMKRLATPEDYAQWKSVYDKVVVYKDGTPRFIVNSSSSVYAELMPEYSAVSMFVPQRRYAGSHTSTWGDHNVNFQKTTWYDAAGWAQTGW